MNNEQKAFNATAAGQKQMANDGASIGTALYMNKVVKQKGGTGWPDNMIETANPIMLRAIKEDLITEFNALVTPKK